MISRMSHEVRHSCANVIVVITMALNFHHQFVSAKQMLPEYHEEMGREETRRRRDVTSDREVSIS